MAHPPHLILGIDTHKDVHAAVLLDRVGRYLATASFGTTDAANRDLMAWAQRYGQVTIAGVEGTGSYGYRLAQHLRSHGIDVVEVNRPDAPGDAARARTTRWTPRQPPAPSWPAMPAQSPRTATAPSGSCAPWWWPAAAPSRPVPRPPTSSARCWWTATTT
jgi:transposase